MSEALLIWVYLAVGSFLSVVGLVLFLIMGVLLFVTVVVFGSESNFGTAEEDYKKADVKLFNKFSDITKKTGVLSLVVWGLASIYPDKDDLKWIIGGALVWNGVEASSDIEGIEKLPENTVKAMNHFLESISEAEEAQ